MDSSLLTVVVPAFNEAGVIGVTLDRMRVAVRTDERLRGNVDVVVVSDGSSDDTFAEARNSLDDELPGEVIQLISNVGSHAAIRGGLRKATGEYIAVMAADGQDPPEILGEMVGAFRPGIDVVWGKRQSRSDPRSKRVLARLYYSLFRRLTGMAYPPQGYDFVVITQRVRTALDRFTERNASVFLLIFNLGFGQVTVGYERAARSGGMSGWTLRKRLKLAIDMLTAFTAAPIRLVSLGGVAVGLFGLIFGGVTLVRGLLGHIPVSGWASLMVLSSLMGGMMLVAIGFIGEYLWRTLDEVRARPLYIEADHAIVPTRERSP